MPHYANGEEAQNGDIVVGRTYNRQGTQYGVICDIIPNTTSCNCKVVFNFTSVKANHNTLLIGGDYDYSDCGQLNKVSSIIGGAKQARAQTTALGSE